MVEIHVQCDTFLILLQDGDCQTETHDREIHRRAIRCQRYDPPAFATALVADTPQPHAGEPLGFFHRGDDIRGEDVEILGVAAASYPGAPLVIDKRANTLRRKHPLQGIGLEGGIVL